MTDLKLTCYESDVTAAIYNMSEFTSLSSLHNSLAPVCGSLSRNVLEPLLIVALNTLSVTCNGIFRKARSQI